MAWRSQETVLDGKIKVTFSGQGQPDAIEISDEAVALGKDVVEKAIIEATHARPSRRPRTRLPRSLLAVMDWEWMCR